MTRWLSLTFWAGIFWQQKTHLTDWTPALFAVGIALYFALAAEPARRVLLGVFGINLLALTTSQRRVTTLQVVVAAPLLITFGVDWANIAALSKASTVLKYHYHSPIECRIVAIDRSVSEALRLTLDQVVLCRLSPEQKPDRVRISLHGAMFGFKPLPGATTMLTGYLSAPTGVVESSGFDFRRHAWFLRLGGLGYSRTPVVVLAPAGRMQALARARMRNSVRIQAALHGQLYAFAATVLSGDWSGLSVQSLQDLRRSNLAHLLAIYGLHMGLLTEFIFILIRLIVICLPGPALHWPAKKIAACGAILAGASYLALSGGNVASERVFVMALVGFGALLFDIGRRSFRSHRQRQYCL